MYRKVNLVLMSLVFVALGTFAGNVSAQEIRPYRLSDRDLERMIRNVEKQADTFRKSLDAALDRSRFDGQRREDEINASVRQFDQQTKILHDHFNSRKSTSADVQSILDRALQINRFMRRNPLSTRAQNDWSALRANLDQLAAAYNVSWRWDGVFGPPVVDIPYRLSDREVEVIIRKIESQSDRFRSSLDRALDRSRLNNTQREDEINAFVRNFYEATKLLRDHFDDRKSTSADVQSVMDRAARIEQFMRRYPLTTQAQNDWTALKGNLDELATTYNVTWGWTEGSWPGSTNPPIDLPVTATINVSDSSNRRGRGYRVSLGRDGRAEVSVGNSLTTRYLDRELAERFFADLVAARPLSRLSVDTSCARSASFGRSTYVTFGTETSPDLSCPVGPRAVVLRDDIVAIALALNLR